MKKRKIFAALLAAAVCGAAVIPLSACVYKDDDDGHEFTVLTVKEETVKDYNTMPVFRALSRETGKECLLSTSPSPRDRTRSRTPSFA